MSPKKIRSVFERFAAANPAPSTELHYETPFQLLVAVILSAQATDKSVNLATPRLFRAAPTAQRMAALGTAKVEARIKTIGLYRAKAKNLVAMAKALVALHQGEIPHDRSQLEALPGVGRKTANVILNTLFDEPVIAVDTHVFRVANRTGLAPGENVRVVEDKLAKVVPVDYRQHAHHWLILHGRYVCKARAPACASCLIADLCAWPEKPRPGRAHVQP